MSIVLSFTSKQKAFSFIDALSRPKPAIIEDFDRTVRRGFDNNFRRQGWERPWAALRPRTQRDRRRKGYPAQRPILERTGAYRRSWTTSSPSQRSFRGSRSGWSLYLTGSSSIHQYHELGTSRMAARPAATLVKSDIAMLDRTIYNWMSFVEKAY